MAFAVKMIAPKVSLGSALTSAREALGWTLDKAARETQIQKGYLQAMESERWQALPEHPNRSQVLRRYIRALGNDPLLLELVRAAPHLNQPPTLELHLPRRARLAPSPHTMKLAALTVVFLGLVGYLGWQVRTLVKPPTLAIEAPTNDLTTTSPLVTVVGNTEGTASVMINEQPVLKNSDGSFTGEVSLARGVNIVTISAKKRYSKPRTIYRTIIFDSAP